MHIGGLERAGSVRRADVDVTSLLLDVDLDARLCASFEVSIVRRPCVRSASDVNVRAAGGSISCKKPTLNKLRAHTTGDVTGDR